MNFDDLIAIYTLNPDAFEVIVDDSASESSTNLDANKIRVCDETQGNQNAPMAQEAPCGASSRIMKSPNRTHYVDVSKIATANSSGLKTVLNLAGVTSDPDLHINLGSPIQTYSKQTKPKQASEKNPKILGPKVLSFSEPTSILEKTSIASIPISEESNCTTGKSQQVSECEKKTEVLKPQVSHFTESTLETSHLIQTESTVSSSSKESLSSITKGSKLVQTGILKPRKVVEKLKIGNEILSELTKRKPKPNPKYFSLQDINKESKRKYSEIDKTNKEHKKIKHISQEHLEQCDYMKKLNLCPKINLEENGETKILNQSKNIKIKSESTVEKKTQKDIPPKKQIIKRSLQERNHPEKWQATSDAISQHAMQVQNQTSKIKQSPFCKLKRPFAHRRVLDLKTKVAIIEEVTEGNLKKKEIASKYDIPLSTMTCILKNRHTILNHYKMMPVSRKRLSFNKDNHQPSETIMPVVSPEIINLQETESKVESRKRRSIDLFTKLSIIQEVDKKLLNKKEVAQKFCIPASTLTMIVKDRARIELNSKFQCFNRKKFKRSRHTEVEIRLLEYLSKNIVNGVQMTTTELCNKAKSIAQDLNIKNFKCEPSSSWIWRFKQRFNLTGEGFCDQNLVKQIQKWHNLNNPHRPNNQRVFCDFCQTMCIGLDKMERHIVKKHLN